MITFEQLEGRLDGALREGNPEVESVTDPGHGSDRVAEIWFEGPVDSAHPVIVEDNIDTVDAPEVLRVPSLSDQLTPLLRAFETDPDETGVHDSAHVHGSFSHGDSLYVGPGVSIGPDVTVGDNVRIEANVTIRGETRIGDDVRLHPGVRLESPVTIGDRTEIHANSVIGTDGYGYEQTGEGHEKIPQLGRVEIGSDVEIGAGVAIDRATYGATTIGSGSKLDNHVHVAHNCEIGEDCLMVAKSGIAGSVTLGDGVILTGMAAVEDHNTLADNVIVAAKAGVTKDIEEEGAVVSGFPARPHSEELKIKAARRKLPALRRTVRELKQQLDELRKKGDN